MSGLRSLESRSRTSELLSKSAFALLLWASFSWGGCGDKEASAGDEGGDSDRDSGIPGAEKPDAGSLTCSDEGKTSSCSCSSGRAGTRKCSGGRFGACVCGSNSTVDARVPEPAKCRAGYYTGNFHGTYRPGAFGLGITGTWFEVEIAGGKSFFDDSLPPLAFTLTEEYGGSGEFQTYKVSGGCMQGLATAVAVTQSPIVAKLTGDLNCSTGEFTGMLEGYYTLIGIPGADYTFTGPVTGQFALDDAAGNGEWTVQEPPAVDGTPMGGGEGSWDAKWTAEAAPMLAATDPCASVGPGGVHTPLTVDGGQPSPAVDAGAP